MRDPWNLYAIQAAATAVFTSPPSSSTGAAVLYLDRGPSRRGELGCSATAAASTRRQLGGVAGARSVAGAGRLTPRTHYASRVHTTIARHTQRAQPSQLPVPPLLLVAIAAWRGGRSGGAYRRFEDAEACSDRVSDRFDSRGMRFSKATVATNTRSHHLALVQLH